MQAPRDTPHGDLKRKQSKQPTPLPPAPTVGRENTRSAQIKQFKSIEAANVAAAPWALPRVRFYVEVSQRDTHHTREIMGEGQRGAAQREQDRDRASGSNSDQTPYA